LCSVALGKSFIDSFHIPLILYRCGTSHVYIDVYYEGGADKSLARPTSRCRRTESTVSLERGMFMCRIASLFLLQRLKGSMSGDAHHFNIETRAVIKFFFSLQGKAPKEIHAILMETLGELAPSYATVKNWVAQFKRDFSICDHSGDY